MRVVDLEEPLEERATSSPGVEGEDGEEEEKAEAEEESFEGGGGGSRLPSFWERIHSRGVHVHQRNRRVRHERKEMGVVGQE